MTENAAAPLTARKPRTWLLPREHGAYGQLGFPLLSALLLGRPTLGAFSLFGAALATFVVHEPLLVLLGHRGRRAARELGPRARTQFVLLVSLATLLGTLGLLVSPPAARSSVLVPIALAVLVAAAIVKGREKSSAGELAACIALASTALPVAIAAEVTPRRALLAAAVWAAASAVGTFTVRSVIERAKEGSVRGARVALLLGVAVVTLAAVLSAARLVPALLPLALVPQALLALIVALRPISPRRLRELGWMLIAASTLTLVALLLGLR